MKRSYLIFFALSAALFSVLAFAATELARVNEKVISLEDFNNRYKDSLKFFNYKAPTKKNVLDDIIKREVGVQEAKKLGLDKDPEVVERINTVLYQSLLDKKLSSKFEAIQLSEKEVEDYYRRNPEIRVSHIFVQVRFDANTSQEKAAHDKMKKIQLALKDGLKNGKTFAEIATTFSEGVGASTGGDMGYQTKDKLDSTFYSSAVKLKQGDISDIVRSQFGYHIIKLTGVRDYKETDKGQIKRLLFDEKRSALFDSYMEDLKKKSKVSVNYNLIKE